MIIIIIYHIHNNTFYVIYLNLCSKYVTIWHDSATFSNVYNTTLGNRFSRCVDIAKLVIKVLVLCCPRLIKNEKVNDLKVCQCKTVASQGRYLLSSKSNDQRNIISIQNMR